MYWYGHGMDGWWGFPLGLILMALFWGAVIYAVVVLARRAGHGGSRSVDPEGASTAERLLAERFARGEIDEEEFQRRRSALRAAR